MHLKEWVAKEGRSLKWIAKEKKIPITALYNFTAGVRSMPEKYIPKLLELTGGACSYKDFKL